MSLSDYIFVKEHLSEAALYEQLAEECCELAHACQKKARLLRGENPTPLSSIDIDDMVEEEYTDVELVSQMIGLTVNRNSYYEKIARWHGRISKAFHKD